MNLLDYARIATSKMALANREDLMQDAIEHVLRKGIQHREQAFIIRSMKNKIIDIIRMQKSTKRTGDHVNVDIPANDAYDFFDAFYNVNPRHLLVALYAANDGFDATTSTTGLSTRKVKNIYYSVLRQVRRC